MRTGRMFAVSGPGRFTGIVTFILELHPGAVKFAAHGVRLPILAALAPFVEKRPPPLLWVAQCEVGARTDSLQVRTNTGWYLCALRR
jgi:hypothetical protein